MQEFYFWKVANWWARSIHNTSVNETQDILSCRVEKWHEVYLEAASRRKIKAHWDEGSFSIQSSTSTPIATIDGQLVKTPKAKLLHILEDWVGDPIIEQVPTNNGILIDATALIQSMKRIPNTLGSLVEVILDRILLSSAKANSTHADFVCDTYPDVSIKNL